MAGSSAATPDDYLAEIELARAAEIGEVRDLGNAALPPGYVERMAWGTPTSTSTRSARKSRRRPRPSSSH